VRGIETSPHQVSFLLLLVNSEKRIWVSRYERKLRGPKVCLFSCGCSQFCLTGEASQAPLARAQQGRPSVRSPVQVYRTHKESIATCLLLFEFRDFHSLRCGEGDKMEVLDATSLKERLRWEAKGYWVHLEAEDPLEKYPGKKNC
jgi:hypothetical protein